MHNRLSTRSGPDVSGRTHEACDLRNYYLTYPRKNIKIGR